MISRQARMCVNNLFNTFACRELSKISSTVIRVPAITGLPIMIEESD